MRQAQSVIGRLFIGGTVIAQILGLLVSWLYSSSARAQEATLAEVVVTAQRRAQDPKDVPMTLTVLDGNTIQQAGFYDLRDYASYVPGLVYNGSGLGERSGPDIVIRGIANSRLFDFETNIGTNTTGFVYDELQVYGFDPDLLDTQRIEVLKGPQGTLYGASAMGGLVKVVPNAPQLGQFTSELYADINTLDSGWGAGGHGYKAGAVFNIPLNDVLSLRFTFHTSTDPGYINIHLMSGSPKDEYGPNGLVGFNSLQSNAFGAGEFLKDVNESQSNGGKAALRFKPNDQFDSTLYFVYDSKQSDSLPNYEPVLSTAQSPLTANQFQLQPTSTRYSLAELNLSYDFGVASLHSVSGWVDRRHSDSVDFAGTTYGALGGNGLVPLPTPAPVTFNVETRLLSQELRLDGNEKDLFWQGSGLDWVVGGFYQKENRNALGDVTVGSAWLTDAIPPLMPPPSGTQTVWDGQYIATYTNKAEFGDLTLHILPNLAASVGVRHAEQDVQATRTDFSDIFASAPPTGNVTIQEPVSESKTTPRATITYGVTNEINLYGAYSEGFRIGGHNPIGNLTTPGCASALALFGIVNPQSAAEFKSDDAKDYEVGFKSNLNNGRLIVNVTAFRVDWSNLQTTILLDQYSSACGASFVTNAGAARINGGDGEVRALLTDHLQAYLTGQYADAKIVTIVKGGTGTEGAPLESAPKVQLTSGFAYTLLPRQEWSCTARADYSYVGARNLSNTNTPVDPAYHLPGYGEVNLRFAATHEGWEYTTYVTNLTNAVPQLGVETFAGGPGNYSGAFKPGVQRFITTSAPRTFGLSVMKKF
jgi:iron complex outermembrane recepter protein